MFFFHFLLHSLLPPLSSLTFLSSSFLHRHLFSTFFGSSYPSLSAALTGGWGWRDADYEASQRHSPYAGNSPRPNRLWREAEHQQAEEAYPGGKVRREGSGEESWEWRGRKQWHVCPEHFQHGRTQAHHSACFTYNECIKRAVPRKNFVTQVRTVAISEAVWSVCVVLGQAYDVWL